MSRLKKRKNTKIQSVEVINQRNGKHITDLAPGAVMGFALDVAGHKDADDIDFIGIGQDGKTFDTWTVSDVLAGHFIV